MPTAVTTLPAIFARQASEETPRLGFQAERRKIELWLRSLILDPKWGPGRVAQELWGAEADLQAARYNGYGWSHFAAQRRMTLAAIVANLDESRAGSEALERVMPRLVTDIQLLGYISPAVQPRTRALRLS